MSDIQSVVKLFADDTSMYFGLENADTRTETLNSDMEKINNWSQLWKVEFNKSKTKLLTISNRLTPHTLPLKFCDEILSESENHKHLGITIQKDCKWHAHIHSVISKCQLLIACLRSLKYRISRKSLEIIYKSFIMPHFDFGDVIWDNCSNDLSNQLETLHLEALRIIVGAVRGTNHAKLYQESGFSSLKQRRRRHKILLYFKIVHQLVPHYLITRLPPLLSAVNPYHRRNPLNRLVPRSRIELYQMSFFPSTTIIWNNLPEDIKQLTSISSLKRYLNSEDFKVPPYFYLQNRNAEIALSRLRLGISDLNNDLYCRHLSTDQSCSCGFPCEDAEHFLLHCSNFDHVRLTQYTTSLNISLVMLIKCYSVATT